MERHVPFIAIVLMMCGTAAYLVSTTEHKMFTVGPRGTAERMNQQYYPQTQPQFGQQQRFGGTYGPTQGFNGYQPPGMQGYGQTYYPPQQFGQ